MSDLLEGLTVILTTIWLLQNLGKGYQQVNKQHTRKQRALGTEWDKQLLVYADDVSLSDKKHKYHKDKHRSSIKC
jgi:hypothetical protein